ncbi:MAG: hypothetical protein U0802_11570 [Candidatus Binatia bacterium]
MPPPDGHHPTAPARARRVLARARSQVRPGSFRLLLVASLVLYGLHGSATDSRAGRSWPASAA